ncbi:hypothetical protein J8273_6351 [Carpediemonas membranifera]|uniref:Uncharacterized protein n=1 Tax=Carpediemonas membranifera TaxID=201153 RepID=A0A8J6E0B3_9EUKA|nr:hypothetical protein J8273_6351 [Carpediemonas membranifera]|eukprot:KAG9391586.1 hypothetical protein J8273_6351 [Carpediemonas membranifera]
MDQFCFFVADATQNVVYSLLEGIPLLEQKDIPLLFELSQAVSGSGPFMHVNSGEYNYALRMVSSNLLFVFLSRHVAEYSNNLLHRLQITMEMVKGPSYYNHSPKQLRDMFMAIEPTILSVIRRPLQPTMQTHEASFFRAIPKTTRAAFSAALDQIGLELAAVLVDNEYAAVTGSFMKLHAMERDLLLILAPLHESIECADTPLYLPFTNPSIASRVLLSRVSADITVIAVSGVDPSLSQFSKKVTAAFSDIVKHAKVDYSTDISPFDAWLVIDSAGRAISHKPTELDKGMGSNEYVYPLYRPGQTTYVVGAGDTRLVHVRSKKAMAVGLGSGERTVLVNKLVEVIDEFVGTV